jgi:predicted component of viral defense system (DUF524 family)
MFRIYIFTSTEFKKNEHRLGTTQINCAEKFKQHWQIKFKNVTIEHLSDEIPIVKQGNANKILKNYTDRSHRIIAELKSIIFIANNTAYACSSDFNHKKRKEASYELRRLGESKKMKLKSYEDVVSDDEDPNTSDDDFIASEDDENNDDGVRIDGDFDKPIRID